MEINGETKELEKIKKVIIDVGEYKKSANLLVIKTEKDFKKAKALKKQGKGLKALTESTTTIDYDEKKEAYDKAKKTSDEKWEDFKEIRDKRNILLKAIKSVSDIIKNKIDGYSELLENRRLEEIRKAEAEKARIARELREEEARRVEVEKKKARIAKEQRKINEQKEIIDVENTPNIGNSCKVCGGLGEIMESADELAEQIPCPSCNEDCPTCIKESACPDPGQINSTEETESDTVVPPQKSEQGQNEPVVNEIDTLNANIWDAICGGLDGFLVEKITIIDKWRHGTDEVAIVESLNTGKRYQSSFRDSCKDMDFEDMNGNEANFFEIKKEEIEITITDFSKFIRACVMAEDGASLELLKPDIEAITELARKKECKPGDIIVPGCEMK